MQNIDQATLTLGVPRLEHDKLNFRICQDTYQDTSSYISGYISSYISGYIKLNIRIYIKIHIRISRATFQDTHDTSNYRSKLG